MREYATPATFGVPATGNLTSDVLSCLEQAPDTVLFRRRSDRGVVVIFDTRLFTKSYGAEVLGSLPECRVTRDLDELEKFFKSAGSSVE